MTALQAGGSPALCFEDMVSADLSDPVSKCTSLHSNGLASSWVPTPLFMSLYLGFPKLTPTQSTLEEATTQGTFCCLVTQKEQG